MPPSVGQSADSAGTSSRQSSSRRPSGSSRRCRARSDHTCDMCGARGMDQNEFKEKSPHADHPYVVFTKGTDDYPKGDCLKCESTWTLGGFAAEFGSKEDFKAAREKDPGVQSSFISCTKAWLEAHNSGKRCRPQSSKHRQKYGPNTVDALNDLRTSRKRVVMKRSRNLRVKIPMKIMTVERYRSNFGRDPEKDNLKPRWIGTPAGKIWGVSFRSLMDGEFDAEDSQVDGVEEEEELDDGQDVLREGQQEKFFNSAAAALGSMSADAVFIAQSMADSEASAAEGGSEQGGDDGGCSQDSSSDDGVAKPRLMFRPDGAKEPARDAASRKAANWAKPAKPKPPRVGAAAAPVEVATPRKPRQAGDHRSSRPAPSTPAQSVSSSVANDTDTELASINFDQLAADFERICTGSVSHAAFKSLGILASEQKDICDQASEICKDLAKVLTSTARAETALKRRKIPNETAVRKLSSLRSNVNAFTKIFTSMKGSNIQWSSVCEAWRNLDDDLKKYLTDMVGVVSWAAKREVLEIIKFGNMDHLTPIFSGGHELFDTTRFVDEVPMARKAMIINQCLDDPPYRMRVGP
jgi:hypothetical protein